MNGIIDAHIFVWRAKRSFLPGICLFNIYFKKKIMFIFSAIKCELIKQLYNIIVRRLPSQHGEVPIITMTS